MADYGEKNNKTKAWELYERGVSYNNSLVPNQYRVVDTNTEFFIGNQWINLPQTPAMRELPKPVFNILKRVASLFIASLTSSGATIRFEPLAYYDGSNMADPDHDAAEFANASVANLLEKFKFDYRVREALYDAVQTGDYCAHFYFNPDLLPYGGAFGNHRGEVAMELVDGINVMFGNPNTHDVQSQPYILLVGRDTVSHLRWEARRFKKNKDLYESGTANKDYDLDSAIMPDRENNYQIGIGGKTEPLQDNEDGKALYVLMYSKVQREADKLDENGDPVYEDEYDKEGNPVYEKDADGNDVLDAHGNPVPRRKAVKEIQTSVYVTKATRTAVIYENVDTGLDLYPIAWGNWERQKNQYHGRALVTGMLPNQISINRLSASALPSIDCLAFPPKVYNADLIPKMSNGVGQIIGVHGLQPGQSVGQMIDTLTPGNMSAQVFQMMDRVVSLTKECLGATDAQLGTANAENTSALMVLQTNSEVPLENPRANLYEWVEDIAPILLDLMGTYYGKRPVVIEREFEEIVETNGAPVLDPMTGQMKTQKIVRKVVEDFDFSQLKYLQFNLKIDVGATSYFSEITMTQTLDNLRRDGTLDVIQYLERIPDKLIPKKQELINELRGRIADGTQENAAAGAAIPQPGSPVTPGKKGKAPTASDGLDAAKAMQGLPGQMAGQYENLPNIAKKTALSQGAMRAN